LCPELVFIYLTLYFYTKNKQCFFFQEFKTGDEVMALWSKTKYPAKILRLVILLLQRNSLQTLILDFEKLDNPFFSFYSPPPKKKKKVPPELKRVISSDPPCEGIACYLSMKGHLKLCQHYSPFK